MSEKDKVNLEGDVVDNAVAEGGSYEIIKKRLEKQGQELKGLAQALNEERIEEFGGSENEVIGRARVRTENNSIARDIVQVGSQLVFGYNVFIGLKRETKIEDVLSVFDLTETQEGVELKEVDVSSTYLSDQRFVDDFGELYRYYKESQLVGLQVRDSKLLVTFQIGEREDDIRVFRWSVSADQSEIKYIDNRGERDVQPPSKYDFEWIETNRNDFVHGMHPHVNILDTVFVETINGDLTVKIENNTEDGLGVYSEAVEEQDQSMDDASIAYVKINNLILLAVTPYKEEVVRYLVYNTLTETTVRIDAIGQSCILLPEDQGIIFPGGYYLETGEYKTFDNTDDKGLVFKRMYRSPNGEDVLYVFYEPVSGRFGLFSYNLISKSLQNPIYSNGYALFEDGRIIVFSAEDEPVRIHPMQIWQSPFFSTEYASQRPESTTELGKIGNSELVRGVSNLFEVVRLVENQQASMKIYENLSQSAKRIFDLHYWLEEGSRSNIADTLKQVATTSELVIDEFEKVQSIQRQSAKAMQEVQQTQSKLLSKLTTNSWEDAEQFVAVINEIRQQRGHIITVKDYRYIDIAGLEKLLKELDENEAVIGDKTIKFLSKQKSLMIYEERLEQFQKQSVAVTTNAQLKPLIENVDQTIQDLDLLSELVATLDIDDATVRTAIVDSVSEIYAKLNQVKARAAQRAKNLGSEEAVAQFSAQFKLFSQSIANALSSSSTPEKCDEQLARLLVQLEDLESQFSEFDRFLSDIMDKREELYESFETHRQSLVEQQQRRAQTLSDSSDRILKTIEKRSLKFQERDQLNTYFASDSLVLKINDIVEELVKLNAEVAMDDIQARLKALQEQAIRALRDKVDIYEEGGKVIKLGAKHRFSVNTQELDLTIVPRNEQLFFHLLGTDFYELVESEGLADTQDYWNLSLESETQDLYRSEYLAHLFMQAAKSEKQDLSIKTLNDSCNSLEGLTKLVRDFSTPLYKQGYQKGIHDYDAARLVQGLWPALNSAGLLVFSPQARALAQLFWVSVDKADAMIETWPTRAAGAVKLRELYADESAMELMVQEISMKLEEFFSKAVFELSSSVLLLSAEYLVEELAAKKVSFVRSKYAKALGSQFNKSIGTAGIKQLKSILKELEVRPLQQWQVASSWVKAFIDKSTVDNAHYGDELVGVLCCEHAIDFDDKSMDLDIAVTDLLGEHSRIIEQKIAIQLDDFIQRVAHHENEVLPGYQQYLELRQEVLEEKRKELKLHAFKPRPLSSFVRNRLINESYLPLIGDNLAKQMGALGDDKRTDLMGLLMMISPPGYGKTTLMEYVASKLGLIFMKINCPSLGHDVTSLDPEQAPNSTARQELEKINLAFEMGNNVMLYLDDIQHTHPEFLQKYISLCDGTRRIEGVWQQETKTYDMRGKKFCVVMAGNPYTESGEQFKVPDMLANRADIYNLGDILGGMEEQFALSYIENALTSNQVLAPLAVREMSDVYRLIKIAQGENIPTTDLNHQYSGAEVKEITDVLQKMFIVQDVILKINQQYIASAAQDDKYRVEPPFKLQGSYRNMNKMTEKISAVMNEAELMQLIEDHYLGESQLLTTGAEENLLKLAELRGNITPEQITRWKQIIDDFQRNKVLGGDGADVGNKVVSQLNELVKSVGEIGNFSSAIINHNQAQSVQQAKLDKNDQKLRLQELAIVKDGHAGLMGVLQQINQTVSEQQVKANRSLQRSRTKELANENTNHGNLLTALEKINIALEGMQSKPTQKIEINNQPLPEFAGILGNLVNVVETGILPIVHYMEKKFDIDKRTLDKIHQVSADVDNMYQKFIEKGDS